MKRFSAHTHLAYLHLCAFSSHITYHTCTSLIYVVVCLCVLYFISRCCLETTALHRVCLFLARRSPLENALGFSLGFTKIGETAVWIGGLVAEWNRRSYLIDFISRVNSAVWSTVPKPPNETAVVPLFVSGLFGGLIGGRWPLNETTKVPLFLLGLIRRSHSPAWPPIETADRRVSLKLT